MKLKEIVVWLFIFVIGSLIASFIINPSSFHSVKDSVLDKVNSVDISSSDILVKESYQFCIASEFNRVTCRGICSSYGLDYGSYYCEEGQLMCRCRK